MHVIIPARYGATRLPGKPLREIAGRPLIVRVLERAMASGAARVTVATDDARIAEVVEGAGGEVVMTAATHASGTDRIAEAIALLALPDDAIVVNLQGDEPLMPPALVAAVARALNDNPQWQMATAARRMQDAQAFASPHLVKVVCEAGGRALYFSRAPIPWPRDPVAPVAFLGHIGLYAYRAGFVRMFTGWGPSPLEQRESLEQLRALDHGAAIGVIVTDADPGPGVDTEEDLARANALWRPA
ncbi:3-deoxy-manno-octulosonate cytidylyltransferase [Acidiferrobacter sp.]|uniref:3-deoxy-manno-octulosonate cytidylyltransferase n=1 Tax=Acidiferrobacter sp. TaxID=1872107 RepID=UPI0026175787|nr:3-deoxy-manno-octulosonate cytidylyltransferase [Acidiferrobacter sp.]